MQNPSETCITTQDKYSPPALCCHWHPRLTPTQTTKEQIIMNMDACPYGVVAAGMSHTLCCI